MGPSPFVFFEPVSPGLPIHSSFYPLAMCFTGTSRIGALPKKISVYPTNPNQASLRCYTFETLTLTSPSAHGPLVTRKVCTELGSLVSRNSGSSVPCPSSDQLGMGTTAKVPTGKNFQEFQICQKCPRICFLPKLE
jgi:hypothetical protein